MTQAPSGPALSQRTTERIEQQDERIAQLESELSVAYATIDNLARLLRAARKEEG